MAGLSQQDIRSRASQKSQYVLITDNGDERTSKVTDARIVRALYEIADNGYVTLERCQPVVLVRQAEAFAITYYADSGLAVYFRVSRTVLRMKRSGVTWEEAADIMCGFFNAAELPDMTGWTSETLGPPPGKSTSSLSVDGQDFRHFGCADVMAALENIIEGKSKWLLHDFTGADGGYFNISRAHDGSDGAPRYKVELVQWTEPEPTGCRGIITDEALLRRWLWDFASEQKFPQPVDGMKSFDVNDTFQRLTFKYLDEDER